jgi:hypothetical protein
VPITKSKLDSIAHLTNEHMLTALLGFRPFNGGQKLFSIEDFDSGRVSFPEEGMRGRNQVVKSTVASKIDPAGTGRDHVWTHQMSHGPVEYQEWPLEMPGVGDGKTAAAPSPAFKAQTQALAASAAMGKHHMQLSAKLDKMQRTAALDLGKVGNELQAATQMLLNRPQKHNNAKKGASRFVHKKIWAE